MSHKLLNTDEHASPRTTKSCSCQRHNKPTCPLEGDCKNQLDVIYHTKVLEPKGDPNDYIGSSVNFKKRYYGHTNSFRNSDYKHSTTLSPHLKSNGPSWKEHKKGGRNCAHIKKTSITPPTPTSTASWPSDADTRLNLGRLG